MGLQATYLQIIWFCRCPCLRETLLATSDLSNSEMLTSPYPTQPLEVPLRKLGHKLGASLCLEVDLFHNLTLNMGALLELALFSYHNPIVCLETLMFREGKCSEVSHIIVLANKHNFNLSFLGPTSWVLMLMEGDLILTISNKTGIQSSLRKSYSWPL